MQPTGLGDIYTMCAFYLREIQNSLCPQEWSHQSSLTSPYNLRILITTHTKSLQSPLNSSWMYTCFITYSLTPITMIISYFVLAISCISQLYTVEIKIMFTVINIMFQKTDGQTSVKIKITFTARLHHRPI
jgi:hypothetical protein